MGSARVPRVGFGVAPKQSLLCISRTVGVEKSDGKSAIARTRSPARQRRALPRRQRYGSMTPTLQLFLIVSAALFSIGLLAALSRRHAIFILIGIEMMLAAANLNFIAFWRFAPPPHPPTGVMVAIFSIAISAAEAAVGLAMVIAVYRHFRTTNVDQYDQLKG
jgi:NADH:ubiquinone oxidoreductase subunit K